jgi:adenylate cyclase
MIRAAARMCLGASGWQGELSEAATMVREFVPIGLAVVMAWKYAVGVTAGAVRPDAVAVQETAEILDLAEKLADDLSLHSARFLHGFILAQQPEPDRRRGLDLLATAREAITQHRSIAAYMPLIDIEFAKERGRQGDVDDAVEALQLILERETAAGGISANGRATEAVVEILLRRGRPTDIEAAREVIDRLAAVPTQPGVVIYEIPLLRLRALAARACGDEAAYRRYADDYRARATEVGFEGHIAMAQAMISET